MDTRKREYVTHASTLHGQRVCRGWKIKKLTSIQLKGIISTLGSAEHNIWLASYAISKGMRLKYSQGLLKDGNGAAGETEEDVFEVLGLTFLEPLERKVVDGKPLWQL